MPIPLKFFAVINGSQGVSMTRQVNPSALKELWASDPADRQALLISSLFKHTFRVHTCIVSALVRGQVLPIK